MMSFKLEGELQKLNESWLDAISVADTRLLKENEKLKPKFNMVTSKEVTDNMRTD